MKIVNRADFIKYPAGTLYYPYTAVLHFGELLIKGETNDNGGFTATSLNHPVNPVGDSINVFKAAVANGESFDVEFDQSTVDDEPNDALLYAVYEPADVERMNEVFTAAASSYHESTAVTKLLVSEGEHLGDGWVVPPHLSKDRFPGHHYVPKDTDGLVELTLEQRCLMYDLWFGGYGCAYPDGITDNNRTDLRCLMDNNRIPTHRDADAPEYRGVVYELTAAGATTMEQLKSHMTAQELDELNPRVLSAQVNYDESPWLVTNNTPAFVTYVAKEVTTNFIIKHNLKHASEINGGLCEAWGQLMLQLGVVGDLFGAENFQRDNNQDFDWTLLKTSWGINAPVGYTQTQVDAACLGGHVWIESGKRHYDAECPEGVDSFFDLPYFKRQLAGASNAS